MSKSLAYVIAIEFTRDSSVLSSHFVSYRILIRTLVRYVAQKFEKEASILIYKRVSFNKSAMWDI